MSESIVEMWIEELRAANREARECEPPPVTRRTRRETTPVPRPAYPEADPTQKTERRFRGLKRDAGIRGLVVTLTERQYAYLALNNECHYCGCPLRGMGSNVDRKNPCGGYTPENSVACCRDCNKAKLSHTYETWKAIADAFVEKHGRGTMWPDEDAKDAEANKTRARLGQEAYAVSYGVRAFALWAVRLADTEEKKRYRAAYRERYKNRLQDKEPVPPRVAVPMAPLEALNPLNPIAKRPLRQPVQTLEPRPPRGGFMWRGLWRPSR